MPSSLSEAETSSFPGAIFSRSASARRWCAAVARDDAEVVEGERDVEAAGIERLLNGERARVVRLRRRQIAARVAHDAEVEQRPRQVDGSGRESLANFERSPVMRLGGRQI